MEVRHEHRSTVTTVVQVELLCKKRSLLRKKGGYVLVGDRVEVVSIDWQDGRALVSSVLPRTTETADPRVANVDHFALVFSVAEPAFETFQVTRFLVAAESAGIKCSVLLNKCDLMQPQQIQDIIQVVNDWGYSAIPLSVHSGDGLSEVRPRALLMPFERQTVDMQAPRAPAAVRESMGLASVAGGACKASPGCADSLQVKAAMRERMSVLAGPSGVGKSSIINALRAEAFDDTQRARLERFEKKMADEIDWRHAEDDMLHEDDEHAADEHTAVDPPGALRDSMHMQPHIANISLTCCSQVCGDPALQDQMSDLK